MSGMGNGIVGIPALPPEPDFEAKIAAGVAEVLEQWKRDHPNVIRVAADRWLRRPRRRRPPRRDPGRALPLVRPTRS